MKSFTGGFESQTKISIFNRFCPFCSTLKIVCICLLSQRYVFDYRFVSQSPSYIIIKTVERPYVVVLQHAFSFPKIMFVTCQTKHGPFLLRKFKSSNHLIIASLCNGWLHHSGRWFFFFLQIGYSQAVDPFGLVHRLNVYIERFHLLFKNSIFIIWQTFENRQFHLMGKFTIDSLGKQYVCARFPIISH